jgi:hypothetical protein
MDYDEHDRRHATSSASRQTVSASSRPTASRSRPSHYDFDDPRREMEREDDIYRRRLQQDVKIFFSSKNE